MTIHEIKDIDRQIRRLKAKAERLRAETTDISPKLDDAPHGVGTPDKLGQLVAQIDETDSEIADLTAFRKAELSRLSSDVFEECCIYLFLVKHKSWLYIAMKTCNRQDAVESIKKRCNRYSW